MAPSRIAILDLIWWADRMAMAVCPLHGPMCLLPHADPGAFDRHPHQVSKAPEIESRHHQEHREPVSETPALADNATGPRGGSGCSPLSPHHPPASFVLVPSGLSQNTAQPLRVRWPSSS